MTRPITGSAPGSGSPETTLELLEAQLDKPSPITTSGWDYQAYEAQGYGAPVTLFVHERMSVTAATFVWNVRAFSAANVTPDIHVLWVPLSRLGDPGVAERLRSLCAERTPRVATDLVLHGSATQDLASAAEALGFQRMPTGDRRVIHERTRTRDLVDDPLTFATRAHPGRYLIGQRNVGRRIDVNVTVSHPVSTIDFDSPNRFQSLMGVVRVDIDNVHFQWPKRAGTARLVHPDAYWTRYGLTLGMTPGARYNIRLSVADGSAVASAAIAEHGWSVATSRNWSTRRVPRHEICPLMPEQARLLIDAAADDRLHALYVTALATGLRQGELLGLRWEDVDLDARMTLRVRHTLARVNGKLELLEPKTDRSRRMVVLPDVVITALRAHRTRQRMERLVAGSRWYDTGHVFATTVGTPIEAAHVTRSFQRALERASLPRSRFHDLRHAAATFLLAQGFTLEDVKNLLGHSSIMLTSNTYGHVLEQRQQQVARGMDAALGG